MKRHPDANVAVQTGAAFDVLDLDGTEGLDEASRLAGGDDVVWPSGPTVYTPSGGAHLYVAPTGLGNRTRFRPGCDWRGAGGYVIVPPSVGPNGQRWCWVFPWGPDTDLEPAPAWLVALVERTTAVIAPADAPPGAPRRSRSRAYVLAAVEDEARAVASAPVGTRNDRLNRAAFALGRFVASGELTRNEAETVLLAAATDAGLTEPEARRTIASALTSRRGAAA